MFLVPIYTRRYIEVVRAVVKDGEPTVPPVHRAPLSSLGTRKSAVCTGEIDELFSQVPLAPFIGNFPSTLLPYVQCIPVIIVPKTARVLRLEIQYPDNPATNAGTRNHCLDHVFTPSIVTI